MNKNPKRDLIIIILIIALSLLGYYYYDKISTNTNSGSAEVIYRQDLIVVVDFEKRQVNVIENQKGTEQYESTYPIINTKDATITLLGDFEIKNVRQEVVIKYDFNNRSMQIIEEESPKNECSKMGISTGKPLICIPNNIRINFITRENNDIDVEV